MKIGEKEKVSATIKMEKASLKPIPESKVAELRYVSTDKTVATVNKKGTISAKGKGTCYIYIYASNGLAKRISVTVSNQKATN